MSQQCIHQSFLMSNRNFHQEQYNLKEASFHTLLMHLLMPFTNLHFLSDVLVTQNKIPFPKSYR